MLPVKRAVMALLTMALLLGLLPSALAAEEEMILHLSVDQTVKDARIVISTYDGDGRFISCDIRTEDLLAGNCTIPVPRPKDGTYCKVYFLDGNCRPIADPFDSRTAIPDTPKPSDFRYVRETILTPKEQEFYDKLAAGLLAHAKSIPDLDPRVDLDKVNTAVQQDYPEIFWYIGQYSSSTRTVNGQPVSMTFTPLYIIDEADCQMLQEKIDAWETQCIGGIPPAASDYEKALHIYRYIVSHADYGDNANYLFGQNNHISAYNSIAHIMVDGYGICGDYAKTAQYLLNRLGIDCAYIIGESKNTGHAWNLVWLDGVPCWFDATWGDPILYQFDENGSLVLDNNGNPVRCSNSDPEYAYFGITTEELLRNHDIDQTVPVPVCTSEEYNYYRRNGLYIENYNEDAVVDAMARALMIDENRMCLRFSDEAWQEARTQLLEQGGISSAVQQAVVQSQCQSRWGALQYTIEDTLCAISIKRLDY